MRFRIAVPSHRRADIFERKTLAMLTGSNVDMADVTIFLSDDHDARAYEKLPLNGARLEVVGGKTVADKFNAIHDWFDEGDRVFVVEDDITIVQGLAPNTNAKIVCEDLNGLMRVGFSQIPNGGIFGIAPHDNAFFFSGKVSDTLKLVVAHAFGFVATNDDWLKVSQTAKTDYERTCRYFVRYGRTVRVDSYGVRTKSYTQPGGMQSDHTRDERAMLETDACAYLVQRFPHLVRFNTRKKSLFPELSFAPCSWPCDALLTTQRAIESAYGETRLP